jgi:hypothetical protein
VPAEETVKKRIAELTDASKAVIDCMKVKAGEQPDKGGIFAVSADAQGKVTAKAVKWNGRPETQQCIIDAAQKQQLTPFPGPVVGTMWEFVPPGEQPTQEQPPSDWAVKMQALQEPLQHEATACGERFLGVDFGAEITTWVYVYNGQALVPTVVKSNAKDGQFEGCVQEFIAKTKFPQTDSKKPFVFPLHFKVGQYGATHRQGEEVK